MERFRIKNSILANKDFKGLFFRIVTICFVMIIVGQVLAIFIADQYKDQLLKHDYEIAGYLAKKHKGKVLSANDIPQVLISEKNVEYNVTGINIMDGTGYENNASLRYFPDVNLIYKNYRFYILVITLGFSVFILGTIYLYFCKNHEKIKYANKQIENFLNGRIDVRLEDDEEESLSKLFHSINCMATSLKAKALTQQKSREFLKDIVSDISHQLKTPITALKMYNEIISEEKKDPTVIEKFTEKSEIALVRMETLIKNLLRITRLDVGSVPFQMKEENLMCLLQSVVCDFETRAALEKKKILLNGNENVKMLCDFEWIREAMNNLVKNALDHTKENDCIRISWKFTPVVTKIIVDDTGNGIHSEDLHFIFKRFYRSRFSQDTEGIGLGLPLVKSIVEAHNGVITVDSELGKGSRFIINFLNLSKL